jgi:transcriptional regulator with XRE-family HTH domain
MHPIARYRRAKGWTQTDLAREVGVSFSTIQAWERGSQPRPRHVARLAEVLGINALQLDTELGQWRAEETEEGKIAA